MPRLFGYQYISFDDQGIWAVCKTITGATVHLNVSQAQADCIIVWDLGAGMIQDLLPDLTEDDRELLLSGIDDWDTMFDDEDEKDRELLLSGIDDRDDMFDDYDEENEPDCLDVDHPHRSNS